MKDRGSRIKDDDHKDQVLELLDDDDWATTSKTLQSWLSAHVQLCHHNQQHDGDFDDGAGEDGADNDGADGDFHDEDGEDDGKY